MAFYNPFARNQTVSPANLLTYKILTFVSFLFSIIPTIYYHYNYPRSGRGDYSHYGQTLFGQSKLNPSPFTLDKTFVEVYWIGLWIGQIAYIWHLFTKNDLWVKAATTVGPHFILFNLLHFAHVMLWVRSHFVLSEIVLAINFLQLASLYFRHSIPVPEHSQHTSISTIKTIHIPAVSMPLVWTFFALFWNGAIMVHCHSAWVCRILANVAIWGILPFAGTFLVGYGDWTVGLATAYMAAGLGVGQFFLKVWALQWMFSFAIMSIVFLGTLAIMFPTGGSQTSSERAPLLREDV